MHKLLPEGDLTTYESLGKMQACSLSMKLQQTHVVKTTFRMQLMQRCFLYVGTYRCLLQLLVPSFQGSIRTEHGGGSVQLNREYSFREHVRSSILSEMQTYM